MNRPHPRFPIVGVGASAGGVEALEGFFQGIPASPGIGFIIVTHLSPDRESVLHEIIARYTDLTVKVAEDGAEVGANCVFVLPADAVLTIADGRLHVRKADPARRERKPIDVLFSTLAKDQGEYAASVVLSGGDGDGALGTKAIKERGGLTLAQVADGHGPSHPDMPQSAISTGFIDFAIPVDQMGAKLAAFSRYLANADSEDRNQDAARVEICAILRGQVGHDFSGYKPKTFLRRVQRRMQVAQLDSMDAYAARLRNDPVEIAALFHDLLINVTTFFRDPAAFDRLRAEVIPKLFEGRGADAVVRVWAPGCATGEEVYSLAILLREHLDTLEVKPQVQIFATDIDEHALAVARAGRYPDALLDGVSADRRNRFFVLEGASYVLNKEVRDMCIFSPHSVIRDPPFSRIDLLVCRNLLIYFGPDVQDKVIPIFHYALQPGGYLFLGMSESVSQFGGLFTPVDKKHRIFKSRVDVAAAVPLPSALQKHPSLAPIGATRMTAASTTAGVLRNAAETQILGGYSPAYVVVNRDGDIAYYSARTGKFLEAAPGLPTRQLLTLARKGLRLDLRTALRETIETGRAALRRNVALDSEGDTAQLIDLTVAPLSEPSQTEPLYLVLFAELPGAPDAKTLPPASGSDDHVRLLDRELRDTRERLQSMIEEYETAVEELKSSNEELLSLNEEMQSTNEELEASKEEMQSLNEELHTVNGELATKVEALDRSSDDLRHLFESTQVATIFLDKDLVIRSFTPAVKKHFGILASDIGRPLSDLASRLPLPGFVDQIKNVFDTGTSFERRIEDEIRQAHFLMRIAPYVDSSLQRQGIVVTFVDVTSLANAEAHQRTLIAELNHRVKNMLTVTIGIAQQTYATAKAHEFLAAFVGRMHAMASAYELLSRDNWTDGAIDELIRTELLPFGLERITLEGPKINLKPQQALSLGMVLHELATNAGKYGALSVPGGAVRIDWNKSPSKSGERITLDWREIDGPEIAAPSKRGFGLKLVERETSYNLRGSADVNFHVHGLIVKIEFPAEAGS